MVLFSSLNTALSGLQATMAALQTTGHNISNASTPGYSRQRVDLETQRPLDMARFHIGRGVSVERVTRVLDQALEGRLRDAASTLAGLGVRSDTLQRLETALGALSDSGLGSQLDRLFGSLQEFANNPRDVSVRGQVLSNAATLAQSLNRLSDEIRDSRVQLNGEVRTAVDEINRLARETASINRQILSAENAGGQAGSANDLRDRRDLLLQQLSDLIGVTAVETSSGEVNVLVGSSFLVFGADAFEITTTDSVQDGVLLSTPGFAGGNGSFVATDGRLHGLLEGRDVLLSDAARDLDLLANGLAYEFNRVQSTGEGLERFSELTSLYGMPSTTVPLAVEGGVSALSTLDTLTDSSLAGGADPTGRTIQILSGRGALETRVITAFDSATGTLFLDRPMPRPLAVGDRYQIKELPFPVVNGSFDVVLTNEITGTRQSFRIDVDLDRVPPADTTLAGIVAQIDALPSISATLTSDNRIRILSASNDVRFSFADDTSGFLAAAGLNAFFTGSTASDLAVNPALERDPRFLSGSRTGTEGDNSNALAFAALRDLAVIGGAATFEDHIQGLAGRVGVQAAESRNRLENQSLVLQQLENQRARVSGVNIDEEAVHMIQYQRAYQASARFIAVIDDLLNSLINGL